MNVFLRIYFKDARVFEANYWSDAFKIEADSLPRRPVAERV